jgi:hypothetical protein
VVIVASAPLRVESQESVTFSRLMNPEHDTSTLEPTR